MSDKENDRRSWERLPEETSKAWAAFLVYRDMLPGDRSLDAAYRKRYAKEPHIRATKTFRAWAKQHDWPGRVEAWDRHLDDIERAATERERVEWRENRRNLLKGFLFNVSQAMKKFDPTNVSIGQLTQAVQMIAQEMRAEMDDLPTKRQEITGAEGGPVIIRYTGNADPNDL